MQLISGRATEGYSASDLNNLAKEAALCPLRELSPEELQIIPVDKVRKIKFVDFKNALKKIRTSVDLKSLDKLQEWNKKYGDVS